MLSFGWHSNYYVKIAFGVARLQHLAGSTTDDAPPIAIIHTAAAAAAAVQDPTCAHRPFATAQRAVTCANLYRVCVCTQALQQQPQQHKIPHVPALTHSFPKDLQFHAVFLGATAER